ncbi:fatty acyl-CoA reductase 1-like [Nylanderia fulva]|uniref:fatty acyl-CoA reductase 1-like n=1 Tax=Nylanderia fulva TaxID=613905 RepID=UPI0010FB4486|nr:fatty acyl-CoA reductase 1-like [Nylanderia fulva]XP_029168979.1 fatty acyl-CoA reductase 1-like [Nylanderia fulva]XP_029168981.1 fatty acyl-CoA reductase 1-like [Nylanderia fulva]XP_029168982.1 fatty acyl-CoA reductase 1-like [Nylanderia fulva]
MDKNNAAKSIPAFYAGQSILLTGATGFLGKVYFEKILRCCPDVRKIFILMRPKKGLNINERLEQILNLPLYDKLRQEQPLNFKKLIPIFGDTSQENLGLSAADRQMLIERVNIIIHAAASVKFNDTLKYAILTNTRSTRDICILAECMKNLIALVYISTAYTHLDNPFIEEKLYSPVDDWRKMIKMAELSDEHILNIFTTKCLNNIPNTYIFSKNLAESVIQEYSLFLPCAIVRPSIVASSWKDPIPGWIDTFNGPFGLMIAGGKGLVRVALASNSISQNNIPVDTVINTIILVTWKLGLTTVTPASTCFVVNCTFPDEKNISLRELCNIGFKVAEKIPFERIVWTPYTLFTENHVTYYVLTIIWHVLPAILLDLILKFLRYRPMVLGLQRKIYVANRALLHFMINEWKFDNTNSRDLMTLIPSDNREIFSIDLSDFDMKQYITDGIKGCKKYLLHEDVENLNKAKTHFKRMKLFVSTLNIIIVITILWMMTKWIFF